MRSQNKLFSIDKFLGINEAADGYTELKMGEASEMVNFLITDGFNLTTRPGVQRMDFGTERDPAPILGSWAGFLTENSDQEHLAVVDFAEGMDRIWLYTREPGGGYVGRFRQDGALGISDMEKAMVKIFAFGGKLWIMSAGNTVAYEGDSFVRQEPYVPLVIAGASPAGGGTSLERINLLSSLRRVTYSADGEAVAFVLPAEATGVYKIVVDNIPVDTEAAGAYNENTKTYTFKTAPEKGVGNVEITYQTDRAAAEEMRMAVLGMPLVEAYNGSTDTRLFVGGNGNIVYYTGVTQTGEATPMYFPALNEIAVDMTGASVTGLVRHYSKMLVFTKDGTYTISYEPVTLEDGITTAGFYLRSANREFGNDVTGQVRTVNNYPRTITRDGIYEWKITSSYYQDERYAQLVSEKVQKSLKGKDISKFVTVDNDYEKTYYVFLNDREGTVLVSRYDIARDDVWCIYRSERFRDVKNAFVFDGKTFFSNTNEVFYLSESLTMDAPETLGGNSVGIRALWESGFMPFGADFRRKFTSFLYVSMLPRSHSEMIITAKTDRRSEYMEKIVANNIFSFSNADFRHWTFDTNETPKIQKVRLKIKKFVYYKLVFRVESDGATATVLSVSQDVRYGSMAK